MKEIMMSWGVLIVSVLFNAFGAFIVKAKLNELGPIKLDSFKGTAEYILLMIKDPIVFIGVVLFFLAPFLFAVALSRMDIIIAYPAQIGLNFLIVVLLAVFYLGETMNVSTIMGILLVLSGVMLLYRTG